MNTRPAPAPILVAVDGTNLLHRAHHAFSRTDRRDHRGAPVWALWGMARLLAGAVNDITERFRTPAGLTVAFDGPHESCRRRALDAGYKSSRRDADPDLTAQIAAAPKWLEDCGFDVALFDIHEADDVCASAAHAAAAAGWRCVIVTSDRDALAHTSTSTRVLRPRNGGGWDLFGTSTVAEKYSLPNVDGVYASYAALRGDPSDDLPGVARVGDKTAAKLLCALHEADRTVLDVFAGDQVALDAVGERTAKLLVAGEANYRRNRLLMDAVIDLPVDVAEASAPIDPAHIAESCAYRGLTDAEELLCEVAAGRVMTGLVSVF